MTRHRTLLGLTLWLGLLGCSEAHSADDAGRGDAGELTLESCFAGIAPTGGAHWVGTQSFENGDGSIRVRLARQPGERSSVGETYPYDMVRFGIERDGVVECITDRDSLAYDFAHHNWDDTATAEGNATYVVTMRFDVSAEPAVWVDTLQINDAAPMTLSATACDATPQDLNHCLLRNMFP
jgi:hypothetical protein